MLKKGTRLQVVDLGSHFVKAALLEVGDGNFPVLKAAAVPVEGAATEPEPYLAEVSAAFDGLADFFDRKIPIAFLASETVVKVGVAYLNNLAPDAVAESINNERSKFVSAFGVGAYDQTSAKTFTLREKAQGKNKQIVAANVFAKIDHLDLIHELCQSRKLSFGGVFPRLFAGQEIFRSAFGGDPATASAVACLVDVGFRSTSIVAFKDANIVFHKVLHLGGIGFYRELYDIEPQSKLDLPGLVAIIGGCGFGVTEDSLASLGLPLSSPGKCVEAITGQVDQLFTKIQLSIDYFSTVAATDFNTSMSTVMAVRKGPELIAFMGGMTASPRFAELASQYFGNAALVLDPQAVSPLPGPSAKTDLPAHCFTLLSGGASLLANEANAQYNVADYYSTKGKAAHARPGAPGAATTSGPPEQFVPTWAVLIFLLAIGGMGYWWFQLNKQIKAAIVEKDSKSAAIEKAHGLIVTYRDARRLESASRTRLDFLEESLGNRVPWDAFLLELANTIPEGVKIFRIQVETTLPESPEIVPDGQDATSQTKPKLIRFKLCGETLRREGVGELVESLKRTKHFDRFDSPEIVQAGEGTSGVAPCQDPGAQTLKSQKHWSFQVSGELNYRKTS
jgi:hypothetical protein